MRRCLSSRRQHANGPGNWAAKIFSGDGCSTDPGMGLNLSRLLYYLFVRHGRTSSAMPTSVITIPATAVVARP